jgi:hypothetical protein
MAEIIKERIADLTCLEDEYKEPLANDLAEFIAKTINDSVVGVVVDRVTNCIFEKIMPFEIEIVEGEGEGEDGEIDYEKNIYDYNDLVELLGPDMAALLGDQIAGSTKGEISSILNMYIARLIETKMLNSVTDSVEEVVNTTIPTIIEDLEMPSASIAISIYLYQDEGE